MKDKKIMLKVDDKTHEEFHELVDLYSILGIPTQVQGKKLTNSEIVRRLISTHVEELKKHPRMDLFCSYCVHDRCIKPCKMFDAKYPKAEERLFYLDRKKDA